MLSVITGVYCFIHLSQDKYWTTLKEIPNTHLEFMQRCNIHLAYVSQRTFIKLESRTTKVKYQLFGVDQPVQIEEKSPVIIGTLTCEEDITLYILLDQSAQPPKKPEKGNNSTMQIQSSPKRTKSKIRSNNQTLSKQDKEEIDILTRCNTNIPKQKLNN